MPSSFTGSFAAAAAAWMRSVSFALRSSASRVARHVASSTVASTKNGSFGRPGSSPSTKSIPAAISVARGRELTWPSRSLPSEFSLVFFVTSTAAAVEMNSAGICDTRPSPIVSFE